jgi:hypothetical protein
VRLVHALQPADVECEVATGGLAAVMRSVAGRYGELLSVDVRPANADDGGACRDILLQYTCCSGATRAAQALQGRLFAQRPLVAVLEPAV